MRALELRGIGKTYDVEPPLRVLEGLDLRVDRGERVAIVGKSGAGKSTLLNIVGLLDEPSTGQYHLLDHDTLSLGRKKRDRLRATALGFVFQENHILGHRTVLENLELKLALANWPGRERRAACERVLHDVGLTERSHALGRLLSGGEKQRLAVARAIIAEPGIVLADEPTGNLDEENATNILNLFDVQARCGVAVVVITHDSRIPAWADRCLDLSGGRLRERDVSPSLDDAGTSA